MDLNYFMLSIIFVLRLFELSVCMSTSPRVDLRASNNVLHIRTCSDSARLLAQLIVYLASYGDLEIDQPSDCTPPTENANNLSESTAERVNTLMEEAMVDHVKHFSRNRGSYNK